MYSIVTDKKYIPCNKDGVSNFLVLENNDTSDETKFIYVLLSQISAVELVKTEVGKKYIKLFVIGKEKHIDIQESDKDTLFNIINCYLMDSDSDENTDEEL